MLIQEKKGNIQSYIIGNRTIDKLLLQWYETSKRIQRKTTIGGRQVSLKFLQENPALTEGDVLFEDELTIIVVEILPSDCLIIIPKNMYEMASICYEIGNKHLPLFFEDDELLVPFEKPLYKLLLAQSYDVEQAERKLLKPLKTTVAAHGSQSETLFSKIMKLTTNE
jgi:urease accessory protein